MKTDELQKASHAALLQMLLELSWVPIDERLPTSEDANQYGDVDWSEGDDIWEGAFDRGYDHATHWRKIVLPNAIAQADTATPVDHNRLVRLLRSGWTPFADEISAIMADAATQIESLMSQRKEWKCTVGNENFVTDQEDIAQDWRDDGLEVVSYFVPKDQTHLPT
jgi:hypothetical protein